MGAQGLPRYTQTFTDKLKRRLHEVDGRIIGNGIKPASSQRYSHRLIQHINRNEEGRRETETNNENRSTKSFGRKPQEGKGKVIPQDLSHV